MNSINSLFLDLTLITIYAGITTLICKKLKQPLVLGYILAGIFAGPHFSFLPTIHEKESLELWADIGVIFLLFGLGLEFSIKKMLNVGKTAIITANLNILFMLFLGYSTGLLLGWSTTDSFFLGSMISMSSTTIIIKAFNDLNIKKQKFTDIVFGILVIEDLMGILLLVLIPTIVTGNSINSATLVLGILRLVFFLTASFLIGIYLVPTFLNKVSDLITDEMILLITISLCFGMVVLAKMSGFSSALGAFIMGTVLAETKLIERIEKNIRPLRDFFGAVFFVSVGMMINPSMFIIYAKPIFVITLIVIVGKEAFSILGLVASGQNLKTSISSAFSLAQVGEFAFIIATLGISMGVLSDKVYPIIVAVSVITTFITPMMIKSAEPFYKFFNQSLPHNWIEKINKYSSPSPITNREEQLWGALFKHYFLQLTLFSVILYAIITIAEILRQYIRSFIPYRIPTNIFMTFLTFLCMAPFLKALIGWDIITMKFIKEKLKIILPSKIYEKYILKDEEKSIDEISSHPHYFSQINSKSSKIYYKLWTAKKSNRFPLTILTSFRILISAFFIITTVHKFLSENKYLTSFLLLLSIFFISRSNWLLNQYIRIESQFLKNYEGDKKENTASE